MLQHLRAISTFTALALAVSTPGPAPLAYAKPLAGTIRIDGSSTVFPLSEAMAEEFQKLHRKVRITLGVSGTGGGYKKFLAGETSITNASRPIRDEEVQKAAQQNIEFIEIPIAYDGIAIAVHPQNGFIQSLSIDQLRRLWEPGSKIKSWKDLDPRWPDDAVKLYGPGPDSGTFDFFTEKVVGKARASRPDFTASENDNALVSGVAGDTNALGYFGHAYYAHNSKKVKAIPIDAGKGPIAPTDASIQSGAYPLAREVFLTINRQDIARPEVDAFMRFYLQNARDMAREVGHTALADPVYREAWQRYESRTPGKWRSSH